MNFIINNFLSNFKIESSKKNLNFKTKFEFIKLKFFKKFKFFFEDSIIKYY